MTSTSQIVSSTDFTANTLRFQKPINGGSPNTYRIPIYASKNGQTVPSLFLATPTVYSFGVSPQANIGEKVDDDFGNVKYYTLPICLHNKGGATAEELAFVELFNKVVDACKTYLCTKELNEQIGKFGDDQVQLSDLKKLNPLYYKKEKGQIVPGTGPMLYPKLIVRKDGQSCITTFSDGKQTHTNMRSLIGTRMNVRCALKIESIFVGSKISLQVKVCEVNYQTVSQGRERLLAHFPVEYTQSAEATSDHPITDETDSVAATAPATPDVKPTARE